MWKPHYFLEVDELLSSNSQLFKILDENASLVERGSFNLYRKYILNKGTHNERKICEPIPALKDLQNKLLPFINQVNCSEFSYAYEKGCSIKALAQRHRKAKHIFHTDIKNFFPSITKRMFVEVFCKTMPLRFINLFWNAVSFLDGLAIGAVTSPSIANRIMVQCDGKLSKLLRFTKYKYTRYADDLIFSSRKYFKDNFFDKVADVIEAHGFRLNRKKTYCMKTRKEVVGILLINGKLSVGTPYKKRLKSDIYNYLTKGIGYPDKIRGRFAHLKQIEPDYAKALTKKYTPLGIQSLLKPSKSPKQ